MCQQYQVHYDGQTHILIFNKYLSYGVKLRCSLINPNQVRCNGLDFWDNPCNKANLFLIVSNCRVTIPIFFNGTKLVFSTGVPAKKELSSCVEMQITSDAPWNLDSVKLDKVVSDSASDSQAPHITCSTSHLLSQDIYYALKSISVYQDACNDEALLHSAEPSLTDFRERIREHSSNHEISNTNVLNDPDLRLEIMRSRRTFANMDRHNKLSMQILLEMWGIGSQHARDTIKAIGQFDARYAIPLLSRRYHSNDIHIPNRMHTRMTTDTFYCNHNP